MIPFSSSSLSSPSFLSLSSLFSSTQPITVNAVVAGNPSLR
ncbi:hypothetical protein SLEP1_g32759 [Rubroshorea leprosula]|uniref:Uncharacterized protein n=1 Tax=Rubroshorea leprosula TaxID=152421 RepID=A0AAV5KED0_9ROSI|nr:hypothetical protein SLEP1_g32759 [Rubroshorea leprosula]